MVEKIRLGGHWNWKKWVAAILFGAIILVFAFFNVNPSTMGRSEDGGVAATVNGVTIGLAEYRTLVDQAEKNMAAQNAPEGDRRERGRRIRQQVLGQLVESELIYQGAHAMGVQAPDREIQYTILQVPIFSENGRFQKERYRLYLQNVNLSAIDFERQIRKELVSQKMQFLFTGAATPASAELKHNRELASQKINIRFAEIGRDQIKNLSSFSPVEVTAYVSQHKSELEGYYKENPIEFTSGDRYRARDLMIRVGDKRSAQEAEELATEIKAQINAKNFAQLATKYSDDPAAKAKGGDLGERERGSLQPQFEDAVWNLEVGKVSEPIKLADAIHFVYLEKKTPGVKKEYKDVEQDIARKILVRNKEGEVLNNLRAMMQKGDRKEISAALEKAGVKWKDSGEFDLATTSIPKLGDAPGVIDALVAKGKKPGLLGEIYALPSGLTLVELVSWKTQADTAPELEGLDRMVAYRKADFAYRTWFDAVRAKADLHMNQQLTQ